MSHSADEKDCTEIHIELGYSIVAILANKGATNFEKWFHSVFKRQHPNNYSDFTLEYTDTVPDCDECLEIMQYNPNFSINALLELYRSDTQRKTENDADLRILS